MSVEPSANSEALASPSLEPSKQLGEKGILVSCPGKVLVVGGYLVLDPHLKGLVLSTEARFSTWIRPATLDAPDCSVKVMAGQFDDPGWYYQFNKTEIEERDLCGTGHRNPFVFAALHSVFRYLRLKYPTSNNLLESPIEIILLADNDFYSQRDQLVKYGLPKSREGLLSLPRWNQLGGKLISANKTGLGSSACLVSSLVGALLAHFLPRLDSQINSQAQSNLEKNYPFDMDLVHRIAQFAHCWAQGKIGSGFDVAAAIYGSHIYLRFQPDILRPLLDPIQGQDEDSTYLQVMDDKLEQWDHDIVRLKLPPGLQLTLGEVNSGSHTPSLVSKVLKWKAENPEVGNATWSRLNLANRSVMSSLDQLNLFHQESPTLYWAGITEFSQEGNHALSSNPITSELNELSNKFQEVRKELRYLTEQAKVPIEPIEQTKLLDQIQRLPGVILAGVPGAGGYDAVMILHINSEAQQQLIAAEFSDWNQAIDITIKEAETRGETVEGMSVGPLATGWDDHGGIKLIDLSHSTTDTKLVNDLTSLTAKLQILHRSNK